MHRFATSVLRRSRIPHLVNRQQHSTCQVRHISMANPSHQVPWTQPPGHPGVTYPPLKVLNSLTKRKDDFLPENDLKVLW
jgi:hypothetical protein